MRFLKNKRGNKKQRKRQGYFGAAHAEESGRGVETKIKKIKKRAKSKTKSRGLLKRKKGNKKQRKRRRALKNKKRWKSKARWRELAEKKKRASPLLKIRE